MYSFCYSRQTFLFFRSKHPWKDFFPAFITVCVNINPFNLGQGGIKPKIGKNVLLVEDIVSDGLTLRYLSRNILAREPRMLKTCCFVQKEQQGKPDFKVDYVGFCLPERDHIVGYGIDFEGRFRNLPHLAKLGSNP